MADSDSHIPTAGLVEPVPRCLWKCGVMFSWALIGTQKGDVLLEVLNSIYQKATLLVQMTLGFVHWGEPIAWTDVISLWWRVARNVEAGKVLQYLQVKIRGRIYSWWWREYCGPPPPFSFWLMEWPCLGDEVMGDRCLALTSRGQGVSPYLWLTSRVVLWLVYATDIFFFV